MSEPAQTPPFAAEPTSFHDPSIADAINTLAMAAEILRAKNYGISAEALLKARATLWTAISLRDQELDQLRWDMKAKQP